MFSLQNLCASSKMNMIPPHPICTKDMSRRLGTWRLPCFRKSVTRGRSSIPFRTIQKLSPARAECRGGAMNGVTLLHVADTTSHYKELSCRKLKVQQTSLSVKLFSMSANKPSTYQETKQRTMRMCPNPTHISVAFGVSLALHGPLDSS